MLLVSLFLFWLCNCCVLFSSVCSGVFSLCVRLVVWWWVCDNLWLWVFRSWLICVVSVIILVGMLLLMCGCCFELSCVICVVICVKGCRLIVICMKDVVSSSIFSVEIQGSRLVMKLCCVMVSLLWFSVIRICVGIVVLLFLISRFCLQVISGLFLGLFSVSICVVFGVGGFLNIGSVKFYKDCDCNVLLFSCNCQ